MFRVHASFWGCIFKVKFVSSKIHACPPLRVTPSAPPSIVSLGTRFSICLVVHLVRVINNASEKIHDFRNAPLKHRPKTTIPQGVCVFVCQKSLEKNTMNKNQNPNIQTKSPLPPFTNQQKPRIFTIPKKTHKNTETATTKKSAPSECRKPLANSR